MDELVFMNPLDKRKRCNMNDKMPLSEIRRILEHGEWWDNLRETSPDAPEPWMDELNGAIEAALDALDEHAKAEAERRLLVLPCHLGERVYELKEKEALRDCCDKIFFAFPGCQHPFWEDDGKDCPCAERTWPVHCKACEYYRAGAEQYCACPYDENAQFNIRAKLFEYADIPNVGETIFLTAKEAEAALTDYIRPRNGGFFWR